MQQKIDKLLEILRERYSESERVTCIEGEYTGLDGRHDKRSDEHFTICIPRSNVQNRGFYYDEKEDTLCVWGRGIGLVYKQGYWAAKTGESGPQYIPIEILSPEIY